MTALRRLFAVTVLALATLFAVASPAYAACGDTSASWVPVVGSNWYVEILLNDNSDLTAAATFTYPGQLALTAITETAQILEGQWDWAGGDDFIWSGTDVFDESYRLSFIAEANDCTPNGKVHAAYGIVIHQTQGNIGVLFMTRIA